MPVILADAKVLNAHARSLSPKTGIESTAADHPMNQKSPITGRVPLPGVRAIYHDKKGG